MAEQKSPSRAASFDRRLAAYAAGAGVIFAVAEAVDADIIYSGPEDITIGPGQANPSSYALDMNGDGFTDFTFNESQTSPTASSLTLTPEKFIDYNGAAPSALPAGVDVASEAPSFSVDTFTLAAIDTTQTTPGSGPFFGVSDEYLAVGFETYYLDPVNGLTPSGLDYGWIELSVSGGTDPTADPTATIAGWAYNNASGQSLLTGQTVPEPTDLGALALGVAGIGLLRRPGRQIAPSLA